MEATISVLSWNLQGEIGIEGVRLQRQLDFLDDHAGDIDLFLFQAVNSEAGEPGDWAGHLGSLLEYFADRDYHVVHTGKRFYEVARPEAVEMAVAPGFDPTLLPQALGQ